MAHIPTKSSTCSQAAAEKTRRSQLACTSDEELDRRADAVHQHDAAVACSGGVRQPQGGRYGEIWGDMSSLRGEIRHPQGGRAVLCSVLGAKRECEGGPSARPLERWLGDKSPSSASRLRCRAPRTCGARAAPPAAR